MKLNYMWVFVAVTVLPANAQILVEGQYTFSGGADGSTPQGPVVASPLTDVFYGTTQYGGAYRGGAVFRASPGIRQGDSFGFSVVHSFPRTGSGLANGALPTGSLLLDALGNIYGVAAGGNFCNKALPNGCGVVYMLSTVESALYRFQGEPDGANPVGGLVRDAEGFLYGVTTLGGTSNKGVIFKLAPPLVAGGAWTETVLHSFQNGEGAQPVGPLLIDAHGALYGATQGGGQYGQGTAYQLAPPGTSGGTWTLNLLHTFGGANDGINPFGGLAWGRDGGLYGGTCSSNGVHTKGLVFELLPPAAGGSTWTEQALHLFGGANGSCPVGTLAFDSSGILWGVTKYGGYSTACANGCGVAYALHPPTTSGGPWSPVLPVTLPGFYPAAGLVVGSNNGEVLIGTTAGDGITDFGSVFQLWP